MQAVGLWGTVLYRWLYHVTVCCRRHTDRHTSGSGHTHRTWRRRGQVDNIAAVTSPLRTSSTPDSCRHARRPAQCSRNKGLQNKKLSMRDKSTYPVICYRHLDSVVTTSYSANSLVSFYWCQRVKWCILICLLTSRQSIFVSPRYECQLQFFKLWQTLNTICYNGWAKLNCFPVTGTVSLVNTMLHWYKHL